MQVDVAKITMSFYYYLVKRRSQLSPRCPLTLQGVELADTNWVAKREAKFWSTARGSFRTCRQPNKWWSLQGKVIQIAAQLRGMVCVGYAKRDWQYAWKFGPIWHGEATVFWNCEMLPATRSSRWGPVRVWGAHKVQEEITGAMRIPPQPDCHKAPLKPSPQFALRLLEC